MSLADSRASGILLMGESAVHSEERSAYEQLLEFRFGNLRLDFGDVDAFGLEVRGRDARRAVLVFRPRLQENKQYLRARSKWSESLAPTQIRTCLLEHNSTCANPQAR